MKLTGRAASGLPRGSFVSRPADLSPQERGTSGVFRTRRTVLEFLLRGVRNHQAGPKAPFPRRRYAELLKKGQTELISPAAHERYRRTLGRLAWAALSRPDLQFVCGFLARHQAAPDEAAETCMRDVLRWVKGLPHKVQVFPSKREILEDDADPTSVSCFTDASWSLNSVSGGVITWENCSLKSFSRKTNDHRTLQCGSGTRCPHGGRSRRVVHCFAGGNHPRGDAERQGNRVLCSSGIFRFGVGGLYIEDADPPEKSEAH